MPKLNFYDTDAVKAFLLNTLVENKEVREDVDFERRQSQTWFTQYQAQKGRAEAAEGEDRRRGVHPDRHPGRAFRRHRHRRRRRPGDHRRPGPSDWEPEDGRGRREMTNTLYEISADFLAALDAMEVDPDTGELLNADQLDALSAAFDEKPKRPPFTSRT